MKMECNGPCGERKEWLRGVNEMQALCFDCWTFLFGEDSLDAEDMAEWKALSESAVG
tara:strand:- start:764 stop:934 length:171 start_codon:yes stop_codon:yes gene_type:complete